MTPIACKLRGRAERVGAFASHPCRPDPRRSPDTSHSHVRRRFFPQCQSTIPYTRRKSTIHVGLKHPRRSGVTIGAADYTQPDHKSDADKNFVETIVRLAHQLGHQVISEGVELPEQERLLRELGVEFSQGFLYSRSAAADEAEMLILSAPVLTEPG